MKKYTVRPKEDCWSFYACDNPVFHLLDLPQVVLRAIGTSSELDVRLRIFLQPPSHALIQCTTMVQKTGSTKHLHNYWLSNITNSPLPLLLNAQKQPESYREREMYRQLASPMGALLACIAVNTLLQSVYVDVGPYYTFLSVAYTIIKSIEDVFGPPLKLCA